MRDKLRDKLRLFYKRSQRVNGCLEYTGQAGPYIWLRNEHGVMEGLHRMSFRFFHKEEPVHVLHTCDNPRCWEPTHLFNGTAADNMQDKVSKGRDFGAIGEAHWNAKLTDEQTREILRLKGKASQRTIASKFGVSQALVGLIHRGEIRQRRLSLLT